MSFAGGKNPIMPEQILISDLEDVEEVNAKLDEMGFNIGCRLIDEFLSKNRITSCRSFRETVDIIVRQGFPFFLNVTAQVERWNEAGTECSLRLRENPLADFVELPEEYGRLKYSNVLCGVIRGALQMVGLSVECTMEKDMLWGDDSYNLGLVYKGVDAEDLPDDMKED